MNPKPILLVVEDDDAVRRFIVQTLRSNGLGVIETGSAQQGLQILGARAGAVDLVITDVVMPRMGGLDMTAELGRRYPGIKILYISGHSESIAVRGISCGSPRILLLKPFTEESLLDKVRQLCG